MTKTDFTRQYRDYYRAKEQPELIHLASASYLSITGKGDPDGPGFAVAIQALYSLAYAVKFSFKAQNADFVVPKLEALWWFDEERFGLQSADIVPQQIPRSEWFYRLLIRMPEILTDKELQPIRQQTMERKDIERLADVGLYHMQEGRCVQALHTGPFDREPETLARMMAFMTDYRLERNGLHHEIYLSDFRKTSPEKLRTILREPVK